MEHIQKKGLEIMKTMKKVGLFLLCALMLVGCFAGCGEKKDAGEKTWIIAMDTVFKPFEYTDKDNNFVGIDVDIMKAVSEDQGFKCELKSLGWDAAIAACKAKQADAMIAGASITEKRKSEGWIFSDSYYTATQCMAVKEGSDIKSSADLAGKNVAVQLGTSGESLLSEGGDLESLAKTFGKLTTCDSFLKCFTELGGGAVDAVIVDKPVATSYAQENAGFTILDEELGAEQYGIAFRSGDQELCDAIEGAVQQLVDNGTYAKIAAKYPDIVNNLTYLNK